MIRFQKSEALQRKIRQDDAAELAIPTWDLVHEAIRAGRSGEASDFLEYGCAENKALHDSLVTFVDDTLTHLARFGEEEILKVLRQRYYNKEKRAYDREKNRLSVMGVEALQLFTEPMRGHFSNFTLVEEPDRYVMRLDPCGSGGRLRRTRSVSTTKKAYPWSWSKSGIPYYCLHCCISEIISTELRGYPLRIVELGERPEDPCVNLFYKKPELIPEEYFTRIGKTKTIK